MVAAFVHGLHNHSLHSWVVCVIHMLLVMQTHGYRRTAGYSAGGFRDYSAKQDRVDEGRERRRVSRLRERGVP